VRIINHTQTPIYYYMACGLKTPHPNLDRVILIGSAVLAELIVVPNKHTDHATSYVAIGCIQLLLRCGDKLHDASAQTQPRVSPFLHCLKLHFNTLDRPIYGSNSLELQHLR